jgi:glutaredoxin
MPRFLITFLIAALSINSTNAQNIVEISRKISSDLIYLSAKNITNNDYDFKFELILKNLKVVDFLENVKIPAGEDLQIAILAPIDFTKKWNYSTKYKYLRYFEKGAFATIADKLELTLDEAKNSIIVFDKDGCPRCDKTLDYLDSKKIKHHILDITEDGDNTDLMFSYVTELGLNITTISTPMVLMGGNTFFNISNLDGFLLDMKKFAKEKGLK